MRLLLPLMLLLAGCRERIVHDLSETDANRLVAELYKVQAAPAKVQQADGKWSVSVPADRAMPAMEHLEQSRLLRDLHPQAPQAPSMLASREEQRFQHERALSREIEYPLASIEGVLQSRVHLNLPPRDPFLDQPRPGAAPGSASVLLVASPGFRMPLSEVRRLVAAAGGVEVQAVAVLLSIADGDRIRRPPERLAAASSRPPIDAGAALGLLLLAAAAAYPLMVVRRVRRKRLLDAAISRLEGEGVPGQAV